MTEEKDIPDGPVLYHLDETCGLEDVEEGNAYAGYVNGVADYGVFVSLNDSVSGLIHESNLASPLEVGEETKVRVEEVRDDGNLSLTPVHMHDYDEVYVGETEPEDEGEGRTPVGELVEGDEVTVEAEVLSVRQTSGPTIFTVADGTGTVECAAFVGAGERAYPEADEGDAVRLTGEVETRDGELQIETEDLELLESEEATEVHDRLSAALDERAEPPELEPLVDSEILHDLYPRLRRVAFGVRRAVLKDRPVVVRHHADADGMASGVAVERAVFSLLDEVTDDPEARYHRFNRMPSRAPFYEMEDVTRDLNYALKDVERHGHPKPIVLMLDNGSTGEDADAYKTLNAYDIPAYVVDHHSPDDEIEPLVEEHVNPYLEGGDYSVTSGMLCVELARLIEPSVEDELLHVPAVAGKGDYSDAPEMDAYVELASEQGYTEENVEDIADALDYESYQLKYDDGRHLINHILDVEENDAHDELVPHLKSLAEEAFERQTDAARRHVDEVSLPNGAILCTLNVEEYTHKFTFPGPGKTTGRIHDEKANEHDGNVVTVGHGPDFCVIRADGVGINIPEIVDELQEEVEGAGVDGGGHLVVGSIKFVQGKREEVLEALYSKVAEAPLKEEQKL
jgi:RecJ-like exonuclease